jgi:hypothetical protein
VEEFEVVGVLADFDKGAAVRGSVGVFIFGGVIVAGVVVFFGAGG